MQAGTKMRATADAVRRRIVDGHWLPGAELPTVAELEQEYPVSKLTLQRALGRLKEQSFIVTQPRQGMFVAPNPPHLNRYGILLGSHERHNRFWQTAIHVAAAIGEGTGKEFAVFRNLADHAYDPREWERLHDEVREHCLAGLVFLFDPRQLPELSVLLGLGLPMVTLDDHGLPGEAWVALDNAAFVRRGIDWFGRRRCRRVAFITRGSLASSILAEFRRGLEGAPLICPEHWQLAFEQPPLATPLVELLLSLPADERPDGLFIGDDHLLADAARGLLRAGVRVPDDVAVLTHCNWSSVVPCPLDVVRLGYDTRAILAACLELIDLKRRDPGGPAPHIRIEPLFAAELPPPSR